MATELQARLARDLYQDDLAASGVHGLSVEALPAGSGTKAESFGVVAWVNSEATKKPASLPSALSIKERGRTVKVPLVRRESKPFQLE
jgi:hypothetical protein